MKKTLVIAGITAFCLSAPVFADGEATAKKAGCLVCHAVDKKLVGPAYKEVAAKYKGDKEAEAKLIKKVRAGGSGAWGTMPMPPNPKPSDAELKEIVGWVRGL